MQCLSGASTDQRMMLVSRPPEATYRELGAQATQFTFAVWNPHSRLFGLSYPPPAENKVTWVIDDLKIEATRWDPHLSVAVCCHQIFLVRAVCDIHGGAGEGDLFDEVHAGVGAVDPHRVPAHLPDRKVLVRAAVAAAGRLKLDADLLLHAPALQHHDALQRHQEGQVSMLLNASRLGGE